MPHAVLFDLDRTLVDVQSFTDYAAALADVESLIGTWADVTTPETDWDAPTHRCMAVLVRLAGDPRWQEVSTTIEQHELAAVSSSVAMPGLAAALVRTTSIPRAVVTLLPPGAAQKTLDAHGVEIPMLIGRNPGHRPKPAPDQLIAAMEALGVDPGETVMIGDSSWDVEAASAAGCDFVGVGQTPFGRDVQTATDLPEALDLVGL